KIEELNYWRKKMFDLGLIGAYENGIGFGNISERTKGNKFIVSGSATGNIEKLTEEHYSEVTEYYLNTNSLSCVGPIKASSESLTHAAIYSNAKEVNAVIHVHNLKLWENLYDKAPGTREGIEYGTVEMAKEMKRLLGEKETKEKKIIVMKGHKEGIISFGKNLEEAGKIMLKYFNEVKQ
ncbi:class II aldolase/adducin family protein, partial [Candidatus Micrarchaeota archaeon]|nr:class II aldolase/adducin family protein [Candidatus Micrarchaeota archaeon]